MTISLHEVWEIINDLSAADAGNTELNDAARAHAERINAMPTDELADFTEKASLIGQAADSFKDHVQLVSDQVLKELDLSDEVARWTSADLHRYLGAVQTKGELAEILSLAPLANGDPRVLLAFVEPQEDDEEGAEATDGD